MYKKAVELRDTPNAVTGWLCVSVLFLCLLFAMHANATAGAALQAPAGLLTADFKGTTASDDVRLVAEWVLGNNKNQGRPFIIADKLGGALFAFRGDGQLLAKAPALYGAARVDSMTDYQANKTLKEMVTADKITPAGIFTARGHRNSPYGASVRFAKLGKSDLLIHRVPAEWRRKILESTNYADKRVTFGCINVLGSFLDKVLLPVFSGESMLFILPEQQSVRSFFAIADAA